MFIASLAEGFDSGFQSPNLFPRRLGPLGIPRLNWPYQLNKTAKYVSAKKNIQSATQGARIGPDFPSKLFVS
jgi:hypothetical protein